MSEFKLYLEHENCFKVVVKLLEKLQTMETFQWTILFVIKVLVLNIKLKYPNTYTEFYNCKVCNIRCALQLKPVK